MIFAIQENGDLNLDGKSFSDFILSDQEFSMYKMVKTLLLTHFVHKNWLKDSFIKNKRNIYEDTEIRNMIQEHIDHITFKKYDDLRNKIRFTFVNNKTSLIIVFYLSLSGENIAILEHEIKI